jgi:hypothetical protein
MRIEAEEDRSGVFPLRTFPYTRAQRYRGREGQVGGPPPGHFHTHVLRDIEAEKDRSGVLLPDISIHTCSEI